MIRAIQKERSWLKAGRNLGPYTFEDFCALVPDGQKADLIDGVIYMASPDNIEAARLFSWLFRLLSDFIEIRDLGEVFPLRVAFRLDDGSAPEPDIGFLSKKNIARAFRTYVDGAPDLAVEIVSPESAERDYVSKRLLYQKNGVREYWIVDEGVKKVILLRLDATGQYREVPERQGIYRSQIINGFWLKPEWLWQEPRPQVRTVLKRILARRGRKN
jgi:Uma2 family endonuclease